MWGLRGLGLVTAFAVAVQSISVDDIRKKYPSAFYFQNPYLLIQNVLILSPSLLWTYHHRVRH